MSRRDDRWRSPYGNPAAQKRSATQKAVDDWSTFVEAFARLDKAIAEFMPRLIAGVDRLFADWRRMVDHLQGAQREADRQVWAEHLAEQRWYDDGGR